MRGRGFVLVWFSLCALQNEWLQPDEKGVLFDFSLVSDCF